MRLRILILAAALTFCATQLHLPLHAQQAQPSAKAIAFFGRVESIDIERKIVIVKHGNIAGYAATGTTEHTVGDEAALKRLLPGDDIRATVHPNDTMLYQIRVVYRRAGIAGKGTKK